MVATKLGGGETVRARIFSVPSGNLGLSPEGRRYAQEVEVCGESNRPAAGMVSKPRGLDKDRFE